jgi:hypothetical protein
MIHRAYSFRLSLATTTFVVENEALSASGRPPRPLCGEINLSALANLRNWRVTRSTFRAKINVICRCLYMHHCTVAICNNSVFGAIGLWLHTFRLSRMRHPHLMFTGCCCCCVCNTTDKLSVTRSCKLRGLRVLTVLWRIGVQCFCDTTAHSSYLSPVLFIISLAIV